jgi:non-ribosomal peptide synthase protein (TIGR01720 family)
VCDEESLRILIDDLRSAYAQLGPGQPPEQRAALPPRTTSFPHWCRELSRHAASPELAKELDWWDGQAAALPLPFDRPTTVVSPAAVQAVAVALDADTSRMLLQEIPARHRTQVTELVLAALARTVAAWAGTTSVCFDVDGSVRGESVLGMDLSRTAGACDFVYPIQLSLAGAASPMAALKAVKEQLRAIPCRGLGYALLAGGAGAGDAASAAGSERLRSRPRAELRVSYRSSFAAGEGLDSPVLRLAAEPLGPPSQAAGSYPLRLVAGAAGGMVRLELEFDGGRYDRSTVERLARRLEEELLRTVAEAREGSALTPADFPDAELGAADLDLLFARP